MPKQCLTPIQVIKWIGRKVRSRTEARSCRRTYSLQAPARCRTEIGSTLARVEPVVYRIGFRRCCETFYGGTGDDVEIHCLCFAVIALAGCCAPNGLLCLNRWVAGRIDRLSRRDKRVEKDVRKKDVAIVAQPKEIRK